MPTFERDRPRLLVIMGSGGRARCSAVVPRFALDELRAVAAGGGIASPRPVERPIPLPSLRGEAERLERAFDSALHGGDVAAAVASVLELELRTLARDRADWARADDLRDRLAAAGIEVRDTPDGTVWLPAEP